MSLRPYKFLVQAVAQQLDADGNVVGENTISANGEPFVLFGCDALAKFAGEFADMLAEAEQQAE